MDWAGDANDGRPTTGYVIFFWRCSHFMEMQEIINHCIVYDGSGIYGH